MLSEEEIVGLLQAHSERVITSGTRQIYISRANVWTTALRAFKRPNFSESCNMSHLPAMNMRLRKMLLTLEVPDESSFGYW